MLFGLSVTLAALGFSTACTDSDARAQAEAHRVIETAGLELRRLAAKVPAHVGVVEDDATLDEIHRKFGEIAARLDRLSGAAPGQQAAAALLRSGVQSQMGRLEAARLQDLQSAQRIRRTELVRLLEAASALQRLADSADRFDPQAEKAMLETARRDASREIDRLRSRLVELEGPIDQLAADTRANRERARALSLEERALRQDAAGRGHAAGFPIFLEAIDLRQQANTLNIEAARKELQIAEREPERDRTVVETETNDALLKAISAAEEELKAGVSGARERAASLHEIVQRLHRAAAPIAEDLAASLRGPVADTFARATQDFERAVQSAGRAGTGGGDAAREAVAISRQSALDARHSLAALQVSRLLDARDVLASLPEQLVTDGQSTLAQTLRAIRTEQAEVEARLRTAAQEALNAALEASTQLGDRPSVARVREGLTQTLALIEGREVGSAAASGAGATGPGAGSGLAPGLGGGMESPEALLTFLQNMNHADPAATSAFFDLLRANSAQGRQLVAGMRSMADATAEFNTALIERWGVEALGEMSPVPMTSGDQLRLDEVSDRTATIVGDDLDQPMRLVRTAAGWFIDADSVFDAEMAAMMAPVLAMLDQMRPAMQSQSAIFAQRVRAGEFASAEEALAAFQMAIAGAMMGGMPMESMMEMFEAGMDEETRRLLEGLSGGNDPGK